MLLIGFLTLTKFTWFCLCLPHLNSFEPWPNSILIYWHPILELTRSRIASPSGLSPCAGRHGFDLMEPFACRLFFVQETIREFDGEQRPKKTRLWKGCSMIVPRGVSWCKKVPQFPWLSSTLSFQKSQGNPPKPSREEWLFNLQSWSRGSVGVGHGGHGPIGNSPGWCVWGSPWGITQKNDQPRQPRSSLGSQQPPSSNAGRWKRPFC